MAEPDFIDPTFEVDALLEKINGKTEILELIRETRSLNCDDLGQGVETRESRFSKRILVCACSTTRQRIKCQFLATDSFLTTCTCILKVE